MNKQGNTHFIFGMVGLFIIILAAVALMPVQELHIEGNVTIENLNNIQLNLSKQFSERGNSTVTNIIYSFMEFTVYSSIEITKLAVEYGIENPELVNAKNIIYLVLLSLLAPILLILFKILIVIFLLVKEVIQSKVEKKKLRTKSRGGK